MGDFSNMVAGVKEGSSAVATVGFRIVIFCICLWACSCIQVKEHIVLQKNGKGDFTLEWDMSAARLFSDGQHMVSAIEPGYMALVGSLKNLPGIQLNEAETHLTTSSAKLAFQYKSLESLNRAMTLIYMGESQSSHEFVKRDGTLITRSMPPGVGERLSERWQRYWDTPFSQEEKAHVRWQGQMEFKSPIHLVYSPVPVQINSDKRLVNWNLDGEQVFNTSIGTVKILTD